MTRKIKLILYHQSANQALPWKLTPAGTCIKCLPVVSIELSKPMLLTKICRTRTRSGFALMASLPAAKQRPLHAILIDINSYIRHTNVISRTTIKKIVHKCLYLKSADGRQIPVVKYNPDFAVRIQVGYYVRERFVVQSVAVGEIR